MQTPSDRQTLPAKAELGDEGAVAGDVFPVEVSQKTPALAHELQETPAAGVVVRVLPEVFGKFSNSGREDRYLDFR